MIIAGQNEISKIAEKHDVKFTVLLRKYHTLHVLEQDSLVPCYQQNQNKFGLGFNPLKLSESFMVHKEHLLL